VTLLQALLAAYGTRELRARYERERPAAEAAMREVLKERTIILNPEETK
jgi:hypothetical protein